MTASFSGNLPRAADFEPLPSEDAILGRIAAWFDSSHSRLALGRGDDCAVLKDGSPLCVSTDMFVEDIHFRRSYFEPEEVGHKALAINVSDIAGFGARPVAFTLCLGLPEWIDMKWLDRFFAGMSALAKKERLALAGGDLSRSRDLYVSISIFGENIDSCGFLTRGGAMPGDILFVVGAIGLARVGFLELEERGRDAILQWPHACEAHLCPTPQTAGGLMLARAGFNARPPALMDLSDGLLRDLPRLLGESGELGSHSGALGAELDFPQTSLHPEVIEHALARGEDPGLEAIRGGEEYALLGACAPDMLQALQVAIPNFMAIGRITDTGEIFYNGRNLAGLRGFDHFECAGQKLS